MLLGLLPADLLLLPAAVLSAVLPDDLLLRAGVLSAALLPDELLLAVRVGMFELRELRHILEHVLRLDPLHPLTAARFRQMTESARRDFPSLARKVRDLTKEILALRAQILSSAKRYPGMEIDVARLAPPDFPGRTPHDRSLVP